MAHKRGDAIAIVEVSRTAYISTRADHINGVERVDFGIVTSVTRDGAVKAYRDAWGHTVPVVPMRFRGRILAVPVGANAVALLTAASAHCWPGHPNQPKSFDSIAEAKAFALPFKP